MDNRLKPAAKAAEEAIAAFQQQLQAIMAAGDTRTRASAQASLVCMPPFIRELARLQDEKAKHSAAADALINLMGGQLGSFVGSFKLDPAEAEALLKATFSHLMNSAAGAITGTPIEGAHASIKISRKVEVGHA